MAERKEKVTTRRTASLTGTVEALPFKCSALVLLLVGVGLGGIAGHKRKEQFATIVCDIDDTL